MTSRRDGQVREQPEQQDLRTMINGARRDLELLTGRPVDSVTSARRTNDGWRLTLEVVELERIPASTSVLGSYEVTVDADGSIMGYERTRRYYRNQPTEDEHQ